MHKSFLVTVDVLIKDITFSDKRDFSWSPSDNIIAYWVPEQQNVPARVTLIQMPSRQELCIKNLFNVADCKMHWQKNGDYLCVKVDRYSKAKKIDEKDQFKYSVSKDHLKLMKTRLFVFLKHLRFIVEHKPISFFFMHYFHFRDFTIILSCSEFVKSRFQWIKWRSKVSNNEMVSSIEFV